jgi:hypothetical protein
MGKNGPPGRHARRAHVGNLSRDEMCVVDVCGFRFVFDGVVQLETCLAY